jgi:GNAT superfamily N-acetyltransferase
MLEAANYSATLRDGRRVAAAARSSAQSLYRRFFAVRRDFTETEIESFVNVDFVDHVALVAVVEESGRPVIAGGARYAVVRPGTAEVAFTVIDEYQGQGLGTAFMHHLAAIARGGSGHGPRTRQSTSSQTSGRAGSTDPGISARPLGMRLKPDLP